MPNPRPHTRRTSLTHAIATGVAWGIRHAATVNESEVCRVCLDERP